MVNNLIIVKNVSESAIPVSLSEFSVLSSFGSDWAVGLNEHLWSSILRLWNLLNKSKNESSLISSCVICCRDKKAVWYVWLK